MYHTVNRSCTMTPLIVSLVLCALRLSSVTGQPGDYPESTDQLDACGQHYKDLLAASTAWHEKSCNGTTKRAACVVPEHEKEYLELKQRCKKAHDERNAKANEIYEKLPKYISEMNLRVNLLKESLRQDLPNLQAMVNEQKSLLEAAWKYGAQLQRELLLTSMESNRMQRALLLHSLLVNVSLPEMMQESYKYHGGNSRMVARMLKFARKLPLADERVEVYKELAQLMKSNNHNDRFPAIIFSNDVKELQDRYKPDHAEYEGKVVARWQAQLLAGNFNEALMFAKDYPEYYARIEKDLYSVLKNQWSVDAFNRMIYLPNNLPNAGQRVRAFRSVLDSLLANQTKQRNDAFLMRLANELTKLESTLEGSNEATRNSLNEAKNVFQQFAYTRDFSAYAELYKIFRVAL
ncbi:uncharacterized protein LOC126558236 [Anopheles maculipalpis]|uniref:uncharacterized protein LOC126558236 n=1 Tax=Anopheles maculipalpis TaxID=1496333 RepID=UPI00215903A5|nr:uncharacterized protein LOC126558236 [Anopheles maculipalpis]